MRTEKQHYLESHFFVEVCKIRRMGQQIVWIIKLQSSQFFRFNDWKRQK